MLQIPNTCIVSRKQCVNFGAKQILDLPENNSKTLLHILNDLSLSAPSETPIVLILHCHVWQSKSINSALSLIMPLLFFAGRDLVSLWLSSSLEILCSASTELANKPLGYSGNQLGIESEHAYIWIKQK